MRPTDFDLGKQSLPDEIRAHTRRALRCIHDCNRQSRFPPLGGSGPPGIPAADAKGAMLVSKNPLPILAFGASV